jgi:hypothetical protein
MRLGPPIALAASLGLTLWAGCGSSEAPDAAANAKVSPVPPISGSYRVTGTTVDRSTGSERVVAGETQMIVALVPGVDPNFGFLPRQAMPRMVNATEATIDDNGSIRVVIDSEPQRGEPSPPTRTLLRGQRMSPLGVGGDQ